MKKYFFNEDILLIKWLKYIKKNCKKKYNFSMFNIIKVAKKLNILKLSSFVITVSGTNGKGSTCAILERCFLNSGYTVGLYTSPHLFNYYERIRINGKYIKKSFMHINAFLKVELARKNNQLTYFEFITLSALLLFKERNLNVIILEVGLGGRLDATNIINPNIAIITNIGLDHTSILGNTRDDIGYEKSGIFRKGIKVIIGDDNIPNSIYKMAYIFKVILYRKNYEWNWYELKNYWNFYDQYGILNNIPIPKVSFLSAAIAIAALRVSSFKIDKNVILKSINTVFLMGRFQIIYKKPIIIVDVAHNSDATFYLSQRLKKLLYIKGNIKLYALIGMLSKKDIKGTISSLINIIDYWYYTILNTNQTATINDLKKHLPKNAIYCISVKKALYQLIQKVQKNDIILIFGSFFTVSEAITAMRTLNL